MAVGSYSEHSERFWVSMFKKVRAWRDSFWDTSDFRKCWSILNHYELFRSNVTGTFLKLLVRPSHRQVYHSEVSKFRVKATVLTWMCSKASSWHDFLCAAVVCAIGKRPTGRKGQDYPRIIIQQSTGVKQKGLKRDLPKTYMATATLKVIDRDPNFQNVLAFSWHSYNSTKSQPCQQILRFKTYQYYFPSNYIWSYWYLNIRDQHVTLCQEFRFLWRLLVWPRAPCAPCHRLHLNALVCGCTKTSLGRRQDLSENGNVSRTKGISDSVTQWPVLLQTSLHFLGKILISKDSTPLPFRGDCEERYLNIVKIEMLFGHG